MMTSKKGLIYLSRHLSQLAFYYSHLRKRRTNLLALDGLFEALGSYADILPLEKKAIK